MDTNHHDFAADMQQATVARTHWPRFIPKTSGDLDFHPGVDGANFKIRKLEDYAGMTVRPVLLD